MKIYLDSEFRCHLSNDGTMREVETDVFDGKCTAYIEGYRYVPSGETWIRSDGVAFKGLMASPATDYSALATAQTQYEEDMAERFSELSIPQEYTFTATRNYSIGSFLTVYGKLYEVITAIPDGCSITIGQNVIETTVEHYLDTLKEEK